MCCGQHRSICRDDLNYSTTRHTSRTHNASVVENLRGRLAETEARLAQARAREAELSRRLEEMKRFVSVMEILETYLTRRFLEQQDHVTRIISNAPPRL